MNLESQVTNLELSKKLFELNVKQESLFYWVTDESLDEFRLVTIEKLDILDITNNRTEDSGCGCCQNDWKIKEKYSAFSVAELGQLLPERLDKYRSLFIKFEKIKNEATGNNEWLSSLVEGGGYHMDIDECQVHDENEANARAKMLIYLTEQGLIKNES